jgi:uncharacterized membrane protein HdeD (DUF308 family)
MRHTRANEGRNDMGIGLGVVLLLVGLIFAFDVINLPTSMDNVVDTNTLGWILIVVGVLAIVLALVMNAQRSRSTTVVEERRNPPPV